MAMYASSNEAFAELTKIIARVCIDVTGRQAVEADENIIPKVSGEFILVDLSDADPLDWQDNDWIDEDTGFACSTQNFVVTYTLTAYRGKAQAALTRVIQSLKLPFLYNKYFPDGSPFAYSSSSSISRMRVPLNQQFFENRARVQILFNVSFIEYDTGDMTTLEKIGISAQVKDVDGTVLEDIDMLIGTDTTP